MNLFILQENLCKRLALVTEFVVVACVIQEKKLERNVHVITRYSNVSENSFLSVITVKTQWAHQAGHWENPSWKNQLKISTRQSSSPKSFKRFLSFIQWGSMNVFIHREKGNLEKYPAPTFVCHERRVVEEESWDPKWNLHTDVFS